MMRIEDQGVAQSTNGEATFHKLAPRRRSSGPNLFRMGRSKTLMLSTSKSCQTLAPPPMDKITEKKLAELNYSLKSQSEELSAAEAELKALKKRMEEKRVRQDKRVTKLREKNLKLKEQYDELFQREIRNDTGAALHNYAAPFLLLRRQSSQQITAGMDCSTKNLNTKKQPAHTAATTSVSDSSYVLKIQSRLCRQLHRRAMLESQLELTKCQTEYISQFYKRALNRTVEERSNIEKECMNKIIFMNDEKKRWEEEGEDGPEEDQIEDNEDSKEEISMDDNDDEQSKNSNLMETSFSSLAGLFVRVAFVPPAFSQKEGNDLRHPYHCHNDDDDDLSLLSKPFTGTNNDNLATTDEKIGTTKLKGDDDLKEENEFSSSAIPIKNDSFSNLRRWSLTSSMA